VGTEASAYQTKLHRAACPKGLIKRLICLISDTAVSGREITPTFFQFNLLDVQNQRALRGYPPLEIIGEQQNKKVYIIRDVFHRLYCSQNVILFLVTYVIVCRICDRHVTEFLFCIF
jgi:hypothetical protein